jgi:hypothetical protein
MFNPGYQHYATESSDLNLLTLRRTGRFDVELCQVRHLDPNRICWRCLSRIIINLAYIRTPSPGDRRALLEACAVGSTCVVRPKGYKCGS